MVKTESALPNWIWLSVGWLLLALALASIAGPLRQGWNIEKAFRPQTVWQTDCQRLCDMSATHETLYCYSSSDTESALEMNALLIAWQLWPRRVLYRPQDIAQADKVILHPDDQSAFEECLLHLELQGGPALFFSPTAPCGGFMLMHKDTH